MATAAKAVSVPLEVYLTTSYRPDCDSIDGELKERNGGERPHAGMQRFFLKFFFAIEDRYGILAYPELRTQVSATHFRVPDVLVLRKSDPYERIVTVPPLLCIEILSPEDGMSEMHERVDDYLRMGVATVWVVDPRRREAWLANREGFRQVERLQLHGEDVAVTVGEMFGELDALEAKG
jgi:Uma2 family endonuclease